jgi:hypothetical protein
MDRHDQRYVGQMSAATEGVVEHDHVPRLEVTMLCPSFFDRRGNRHRHGTQVHRHVIAHGNDPSCGIEHRA